MLYSTVRKTLALVFFISVSIWSFGQTIGQTATDRANLDGTGGILYADNSDLSSYNGYSVDTYQFYTGASGLQITPVLMEDNGSSLIIRGIGTTRIASSVGVHNFSFGLVSGSDVIVNSNYRVGWRSGGTSGSQGGIVDYDAGGASYDLNLGAGGISNGSSHAVDGQSPFSRTYSINFTLSQPEPNSQTSSLNVTSGINSAYVNWSRGNGTNVAVFAAATTSGSPAVVDGNGYSASSTFGSGSTPGSGWFCVYNGTGANVTVTGLSASTDYRFVAYEYNGSNNYLTSESSNFQNSTTETTISGGQSALVFDGASSSLQDYVTLPSLDAVGSSAAFTIEAWVKVDASLPTGWRTILEFENDKPYFGLQNGTDINIAGTSPQYTLTADQWTHVAAAYDGTTLRIVVDGVEQANQVITPANSGVGAGIGFNSGDNGFRGWIDEIRYWNVYRDPATINAGKDTELVGNELNLLAYYNFNQGGGTLLTDISGNGHTGTLLNGSAGNADGNLLGPIWTGDTPTLSAADVTAPAFNGTPSVTFDDNDATLTVQMDEVGDAHWGVYNQANTLTAQEVKDGIGTGQVNSGALNVPTANTDAVQQIIGLLPSTTYYLYVASEDALGNLGTPSEIQFTTDPAPENAALLDGVDDFFSHGRTFFASGLTLEGWVKTNSTDAANGYNGNPAMPLIGDTDNSIRGAFGVHAGKVRYTHWDGTGTNFDIVESTSNVNNGNWHHIAVTHNQSSREVNIYVDGNLEATATTTAYQAGMAFNVIGTSYNGGTQDYFQGDIDEVRLWNRPLTRTEIQTNISNSLTSGTGLVSAYSFNQSSYTLLDQTVAANNGGLNGGVGYIPSTALSTDISAPILSDLTIYDIGETTIDVNITNDEIVDLSYVITTSSTAPTATQIIAGQNDLGSPAINYHTYNDITNQVQDFGIGSGANGASDVSLTSGTTYYIYWVAVDEAANVSEIIAETFTTTITSNVDINTISVPASILEPGTTDNLIYKFELVVTSSTAELGGFFFTPVGTSQADFDQFSFYESIGADDFEAAKASGFLGSTDFFVGHPSGVPDGSIGFLPSVEKTYAAETTIYIYVTADISSGATLTNTISLADPDENNIGFGDANKDVLDFSGSSTFTINFPPENVLNFDGVNDFVTAADPAISPPMSIEFWTKLNSTNTDPQLLLQFGGVGIYVSRYTEGRVLAFFDASSGNNSASDESTVNLLDDQWHHIVATTDGSVTRLYIDGTLDVSHNETAISGSTPLYIGSNQGTDFFMMGEIDDVRVWNVERTSTQILGNLTTKISSAPGLVASYDFNKDAGTDLFDLSGNGNDGTLTNFALTGITSNWVSPTNFPTCAPQGKFIGTTDSDWNNSDNWCGNVVPTNSNVTENVVVSEDSDIVETEDLILNANDFQVSEGASLDLNLSSFNLEITNNATFTNDGIVNVTNGTIINATSGNFTNNGTVNVENGTGVNASTGSFTNRGIFFFESGSTLAAPTGTFINEGVIKGFANVTDNFINPLEGTVAPGASPGCMNFAMGFTNEGVFEVEINGTTPCTEYDQITVTGTANLDGTLDLIPGFTPTDGAQFLIIDADVISGTFSSTNLPATWSIDYGVTTPGNVVLTYTAPTPVENALAFDGSDDYVDIPTFDAVTDQFTVEAWVNTNGGNTRIFAQNEPGLGPEIGLWFQGPKYIEFTINADNNTSIQYAIYENDDFVNRWVHVAGVYDGANMTLYINGSEVSTAEQTGNIVYQASNVAYIGAYPFSTPSTLAHYNGEIDELAIWNEARTPAQIYTDATTGLVGNEANLYAYYNFNQGDAGNDNTGLTTLVDQTANSRDGALVGPFDLTGTNSNWVSSTAFADIDNEIVVRGNAAAINSGDATPNVSDDTDFEIASPGAIISKTFRIFNSGIQDLTITDISTNNADFSILSEFVFPETLAPWDSIDLDIDFTAPLTEGVYTSTITIESDDSDEGTYTFDITGESKVIENALSFDGSNDYVSVDNNTSIQPGTGDFTIEFWMKSNYSGSIPSALKFLLAKYGQGGASTDDDLYQVYFSGTSQNIIFELRDASGNTQSLTSNFPALLDDEWHHIAAVRDVSAPQIRLYVDGVLDISGELIVSGDISSSNPLLLGARENLSAGREGHFSGEMDELRLWNTVRTHSEILNSMNQSLVTGFGLVASYDFNTGEPAGTNTSLETLSDISGNANTGMLNSFALSGNTSNWVASDATNGAIQQETIIAGTTTASNNGIIVTDGGFLIEDNDFVTFSYSNPSTDGAFVSDINSNVIDSRWERDWYVLANDENFNGGEVSVTFDFAALGLGTPTGKYALLYRESLATQFQAVVFTYTITGDQVTFTGDGLNLPTGYYTIGNVTTQSSTTLFVNANAFGTNDGSSWSNAFDNLQGALAVAGTNVDIWVAKGTYLPHTNDREVSFRIADTDKNNLRILGGFAGNESLETERDSKLNITVLSGDLLGDDDENNITPGETTRSENSLHVLYVTSVVGLYIDGFTITGGNANDAGVSFGDSGGGIINFATMDIYNSTFTKNTSSDEGAGLWYNNGAGDLINITVSNNHASVDGGGMYISGTHRIFNSVFSDNTAQNGGGLYITTAGSFGIVSNSIFFSNDASLLGGAIYSGGNSSTEIVNNTIYGNQATNEGGGIYVASNSSNPIWNNIISTNFSAAGADVQSLGSSDVNFNLIGSGAIGANDITGDPIFTDENNGDFTLQTGSLGINGGSNDLLAQDRPDLDEDLDETDDSPFDFAGNARVQGGAVDMGAYEFDGGADPLEKGNSLDFDGANDYIIVNTNSPFLPNEETDDYTIETWFKTADRNTDQGIVVITGDGTIAPSSAISSDAGLHWKVRSGENATNFVDISGGFLENDTWHHVAAVKDGSDYRLYLDGIEIANSLGTTIFDATNDYGDRDKIVLGANWNNSAFTSPLDGELDETRIWNVARTVAEIRDNLQNTIPNPATESTLMSYYDFNQGVAGGNNTGVTSLIDRANGVSQQNDNNGTFIGFALDGSVGGGLERNFVESNALRGFVPEDPSGLYTIDVSSSQIDLAWNDNSHNETAFKIERSTDLFGTFSEIATVPADQTTYEDYDVVADTEYWYNIRAINETGFSQYNNLYINGNTFTGAHNALDFDGIDDYLEGGNDNLPNEEIDDYSLEGWFLTNDNSVEQGLIAITGNDVGSDEPTSGVYITSAGQLGWRVFSSESATPFVDMSGGTIVNGTWYHFAATKNGSDYRLYLDGAEVNSSLGTTIFDATNDYSDRDRMIIGADWDVDDFANPLDGQMDEIRYWNDTRTSGEITDNQFNTIRGDESNLEAYYQFDEGTADGFNNNYNSTSDRSKNDYNPTLLNFDLNGTSSNYVSSGAMDAGGAPTAPSNTLALNNGQNTVQIQWTDNSANESSFEILRSDNEGPFNAVASVAGNVTNYTDNTVTPDNSYLYKVSAISGANISPADSAYANTSNYPGTALLFDEFYYINVPDNASIRMPGTFTIEFWMKTSDTGNKIILEKGSANAEYSIQQSSGDKMLMQVGTTPIISANSYNDGNWHHFAFVYRGASDGDIYVDGVRDVDSNNLGTPTYTSDSLNIGSRGGFDGIIGELDEVRIWNTDLSVQQIKSQANVSLQGNETDLVAYYKLDQTSGEIAPDHSLSRNHGSLMEFMEFQNDAYTSGAIRPSNFFVREISDTEIRLTWDDNLEDETDYILERSLLPDFSSPTVENLGADATSYTDVVASNEQYFYRVQADRSGTLTGFSDGKFGTTLTAPGNALDFDGVDDYVQGPSLVGQQLSNFTIEVWFQTSTGGAQNIVSIGADANDQQLSIKQNASNFILASVAGSTGPSSVGTLNDGNWHHAAATYDGVTLSLYIDGAFVDSTTPSLSLDFSKFRIGIGSDVANQPWTGQIDEVRIWNLARSSFDLQLTTFTPLVGDENGLVAYYKFDQGFSISDNTGLDVLPDRSSNNNTGELQGFALTGSSSNWFTSGALNSGGAPNFPPGEVNVTKVSDSQLDLEWFNDATNATSIEVQSSTTIDGSFTLLETLAPTENTYSHTGLAPGDGVFYKVVAVNGAGANESDVVFGSTVNFPGYAVSLDGSDDYIDLSGIASDFAGESNPTIEFWFNANSTQVNPGEVALFFINNPGQEDALGFMIGAGSTQDGFIRVIDQGVTEVTGTTYILDDKWHHFAYTFDGTTGILYLDGVVEGSHTLDYTFASNDDWSLGQEFDQTYPVPSDFFTGSFDEFKWTSDNVKTDFSDRFDEPTSFYAAHYQMDENVGIVLTGSPVNADIIGGAGFILSNATAPTAPSDLFTTEQGNSQITLTWTDNSSNETGFQIERSTDASFGAVEFFNVGANVTTFVDGGLGEDERYFYRVSGNSEIGLGAYSNIKFGSTLTAPATALSFDGTDDYVEIPDNDDFTFGDGATDSPFSIEFWVSFDVLNQNQVLVDRRGSVSADREYVVQMLSSNVIQFSLFDGSSNGFLNVESNSFTPEINKWYHLAVTYDGSSSDTGLSIYVDGVITSVDRTNSVYTAMENIAIPTEIGISNTLNPLSGEMDELRIWNSARNSTEIQDNMFNTLDGTDPNLVVYYRFDQTQPTDLLLPDRSTNNNNGTWNGAVGGSNVTPLWQESGAMPVAAPTDLFVEETSSSVLTLSWSDNSVNETGFLIDRYTKPDFSDTPTNFLAAIDETSFTDNTVANGVGYYYQVSALSAANNFTGPSNVAFASTYAPPHNALDFDGTDDYVDVPRTQLPNGMTLEAWINTASTDATSTFIRNPALTIVGDQDSGLGLTFGVTDGFLELNIFNGTNWNILTGTIPVNTGDWVHVAAIHDMSNNNVRLYVNGVEDVAVGVNYDAASHHFSRIGSSYNTGDVEADFFDGQLDEVRIWNVVRTEAEITGNIYSSLSGTETDLVAYYKFDQGIADANNATALTLYDRSINQNDGTLNGFDLDNTTSNWVASEAMNTTPFEVSNTFDAGPGSLRQAIIDANASASKETISFNIDGSGPWMIDLQSALPIIDNVNDLGMVIDASSQPGFDISNGIVVTIDGTNAGAVNGLNINDPVVEVYGLQISNFNLDGIRTTGSSTNITIGASGVGNVINGNGNTGINVGGSTTATIAGNIIGLDASGSSPLGNGGYGILLANSISNILIDGNTISANSFDGLYLGTAGSSLTVNNNIIGLTSDGLTAAGNSQEGVRIGTGTDITISNNSISANEENGIEIAGDQSNLDIRGNTIGLNINGVGDMILDGDLVTVTSDNTFGNQINGIVLNLVDGSSTGNSITGNTISGNGLFSNNNTGSTGHGIFINTPTQGFTIQDNIIGLEGDGSTRQKNINSGIYISSLTNSVIGGSNANELNLIGYNGDYGIEKTGTNTNNVDIHANEFICNEKGGIGFTGTPDVEVPIIIAATTTEISGTSTAVDGSEIILYEAEDGCNFDQGSTLIGQFSDAILGGNWTISGSFDIGKSYVAVVVDDVTELSPSQFSASLTATPSIALGTTVDNTDCISPNGSIQITGLDPNTTISLDYNLDASPNTIPSIDSDGSGNIELTGLAVGSYTNIQVSQGGLLSNIINGPIDIVDNFDLPLISTSITDNTFCVGSNGSVTATATTSGGEPSSYTFTWYPGASVMPGSELSGPTTITDGAVGSTITNLVGSTYTVEIVNDDTGCSTVETVAVADSPDVLSIDAGAAVISDEVGGATNGSIDVTGTVSGGSGSYSYNWVLTSEGITSISTSSIISNLAADSYTLEVMDNITGCVNAASYEVVAVDFQVVGITRNNSNPSNNPSSIEWNVEFNNTVTGLTATNFTLNEVGMSGSTIDNVIDTGDNLNWTVSATLGSPDGTIGLDLTDGVTGLSGSLSNVPFTGEVYTVDRTAPTITFDQNGLTVNSTILTGSVDDPSATITISFDEGTTFSSVINNANGTWTYDLSTNVAEFVGDGAYNTIDIEVIDLAGNSDFLGGANIIIDTTPPSLTINSPIAGDDFVNTAESGSVTIDGTSDADGETVTLTIFDGVSTLTPNALVSAGVWTTSVDMSGLVDGSINIDADVSDEAGNAITVNTVVTLDQNSPVFTSASTAGIDENIAITTVVYTALATDAGEVTYSLSGTDAAVFALDGTTGELTFVSIPDFEVPADANTDNVYEVTVTATDDATNSVDLALTITVNDLDEDAPTFTSASTASIDENLAITTVVYTAEATDAGAVTYSLSGTDAAAFVLDGTTGELTFVSIPDFEVPADANTDNVYEVTVTATDDATNSVDLALTITVNDLDEDAPTFTSAATTSIDENIAITTVVYTALATDAGAVTYSLSGTDAAAFALDGTTGELTFVSIPDFETKSSYEVVITATDAATNSVDLTLTITVNDLDEDAPTLTLSSATTSPANTSPIIVDIVFSEDVTGFAQEDITVTNGTLSNFIATDGSNYTVDVTPTVDGEVTVGVAEGVAQDVSGNGNVAAATYSIDFDGGLPSVMLSTSVSSPTNATIITIDILFSEDVTGFGQEDITVSSGTLSNFTATDGANYTVDVTPTVDGEVTIDVAAGVAQDGTGNGNTEADQLSITSDRTAPEVTVDITGTSTASPSVTGTIDDNTATISVSIEGTNYTPTITGTSWEITAGTITPDLTDGTYEVVATATDVAGNVGVDDTSDELTISQTVVALQASNITSSSLRANWSAGESDVIGYELDVSLDGFTTFVSGYNAKSLPSTQTSDVVTGLDFGTTYSYRVRLVNSEGAQGNSNTRTPSTSTKPETIADFNALETIYNETGGTSWTDQKSWRTARLQDWVDVTIDPVTQRVTGVDLSNNNLTGSFPLTPDLTALTTLNISDNSIENLANLSELASLTNLNVSQNNLEFDDLIPLVGISTIDYTDQSSVQFNEAETEAIEVRYTSDYELTVTVGGTDNSYEWFRNGEAISSDGVEFFIDGERNTILEIDYDNMGAFTAEVRNVQVPDLTILVDGQEVLAIADMTVEVRNSEGVLLPELVDGYLMETTRLPRGFDTLEIRENVASTFVFPDVVLGNYLMSAESDPEKYVATYFGESEIVEWNKGDTVFFRSDDAIQLQMVTKPVPFTAATGGDGNLDVLVEDDFGSDGGRIDARRRAARRKCGLRRKTGGGRTSEDEDGFTLVAYGETDDNGEFQFGFLPEGTYRFFVEYPGIPLDDSSFVEFEVGEAGISDTDFKLEAFATENGLEVTIEVVLGVILDYFKDLSVYPNPADKGLFIKYRHLKSRNVTAELVDLTGATKWSKELASGYDGDIEIDVRDMEEGVYLLYFYDRDSRDENVVAYRVIVQH